MQFPNGVYFNQENKLLDITSNFTTLLSETQIAFLEENHCKRLQINLDLSFEILLQISQIRIPKIIFNLCGNLCGFDNFNSEINFEFCQELKIIDSIFSNSVMFFSRFPNIKKLSLVYCEFFDDDTDFGQSELSKVVTFKAVSTPILSLPLLPNVERIELVDTNTRNIQNFPKMKLLIVDTDRAFPLNSTTTDLYVLKLRSNFLYTFEGLPIYEIQAQIDRLDPVDLVDRVDPVDEPDDDVVDEHIELPQAFENDDPHLQKLWNSLICQSNFDVILQNEFNPNDQIITILTNLNNKSSVAHCFTLQSFIDLWSKTLSSNQSNHQNYKWDHGPIESEPVFKIPILEVWIDFIGYQMIMKYKSHYLKKINDEQAIGSSFGVSRIHGSKFKLYTLIPIESECLENIIKTHNDEKYIKEECRNISLRTQQLDAKLPQKELNRLK